jgi:AAA ATPase central domain protein
VRTLSQYPFLIAAKAAVCYNSSMDNFDLFSVMEKKNAKAPLAERFRPETLDEFIGQEHIVGRGKLLRRAIMTNHLGSCIFWGPPGCGKTTLANILAHVGESVFEKLNAVSSGVADCKRVIEQAAERLKMYGQTTYLLLDECHRFNKAQSDCLLPAIEKGTIIFIGSTTENPYVSMTPAIVSRCRIFEFRRLTDADIDGALRRAATDERKGLGNLRVRLEEDALKHLVWAAHGDLRTALNALELAALTTTANAEGEIVVDLEAAEGSIQQPALSVDENLYYDLLSAFCKSLRGSDADAALYYMERLISAGCDPMLIARRLVVHSSEDVGMADPQALVIAASAMYAFQNIGLPEGRIPLANAVIYVCQAQKSNSVVAALASANEDAIKHPDDNVPVHLRDTHYFGSENRTGGYLYPHDFGGYVEQQYLPDSLKERQYYHPGNNGYEAHIDLKKWAKRKD